MSSEVARLLQQIREEEEAARRGLEGYATVSKHAFITTRMENVGRCVDQLVEVVGSEEVAMNLIVADQLQQGNTSVSAKV